MRRAIWIGVLLVVMTACSDEVSEEQINELSAEYDVLKEEVNQLKAENMMIMDENNDLKNQVAAYEEEIDRLSKEQDIQSYEFDILHTRALAYRKDIIDIFRRLDLQEDQVYIGVSDLSDNQRVLIEKAVESYFMIGYNEGYNTYKTREYIGEKPEPYQVLQLITVKHSEPMFYFGENPDKTLHIDVYYYMSRLDFGGESNQDIRGMFDGVSFIHVVLEEMDGQWEIVYAGRG